MEKLSFERELELSDALVARREVRRRAAKYQGVSENKVNFKLLNADDKDTWRRGDEAASQLVISYMSFIESKARQVASRYNVRVDTVPSLDDVVHEGVMAAFTNTWAYNLRSGGDAGKRHGKRFSAYAGRHITRNMTRLCMREATPYHIDVNVVKATRSYHATKSALRDKLNRVPTDKEVRENLYVGKNSEIVSALPMRSQFGDVHEHSREDGGYEIPVQNEQEFTTSEDVAHYNGRLAKALCSVVSDRELVKDILVYIGADRGHPRNNVNDYAEYLGATPYKARKRIAKVLAVMTHPAYRSKLRRVFRDGE